jgi:hypothetical protein
MEQLAVSDAHAWVQYLSDGAISAAIEDTTLVLHTSQKLQERFETLLDKRKAGTLSPEEEHEAAAIGELDTALSWLHARRDDGAWRDHMVQQERDQQARQRPCRPSAL